MPFPWVGSTVFVVVVVAAAVVSELLLMFHVCTTIFRKIEQESWDWVGSQKTSQFCLYAGGQHSFSGHLGLAKIPGSLGTKIEQDNVDWWVLQHWSCSFGSKVPGLLSIFPAWTWELIQLKNMKRIFPNSRAYCLITLKDSIFCLVINDKLSS